MRFIDVDSNTCSFLRKCNEQINGNKNVIALRTSKANQYIYGAIVSVDDDVKCDKDSVEDREVPLITLERSETRQDQFERIFEII